MFLTWYHSTFRYAVRKSSPKAPRSCARPRRARGAAEAVAAATAPASTPDATGGSPCGGTVGGAGRRMNARAGAAVGAGGSSSPRRKAAWAASLLVGTSGAGVTSNDA